MAIPASDLTNTHTNGSTDDPSQARAEINAAILKINAFIDAMGVGANEGLKLDSNGNIPSGTILAGQTATIAELNYNDITAAGTAQASKAVILDANKDVTGIRNLTTTLVTSPTVNITTDFQLGGATVNTTAAELNALFGAGVSATEMAYINSLTANAQTALDAITANNWVVANRITANIIPESKIDYANAGGLNQTIVTNGEITHTTLGSTYADIGTDATFFSLYIPTNANSVEFRAEMHTSTGGAITLRLTVGGQLGAGPGVSSTSYAEDTGTVDVTSLSGWVDCLFQWKKAGAIEDVAIRRISVRII